ncbi:N-acetylmuramoyl-L-alanine amidase-like domain-containing protein [Hoylesella shahii]|uniref:N-acetylmuramoyl-L-alanine amidase-like domain-containing protein n=1 Tax=Hoylesella shahii TaxID=228603 RepID=UPI0028E44AE0|nr:N-acetylmuramoyl-L-alanine amidase-like domain-containing protein [Hoylesella shahii]
MKKAIIACLLLVVTSPLWAKAQYTTADSIKVVKLLQEGKKQKGKQDLVLFFARKFLGIPYVASTLENNTDEQLVINLRQLDCTTFVENVLTLTLCTKNGQTTFDDFCNQLRKIRYRNGNVGYPTRLHYFSEWISDNTRMGFVEETQAPNPPFSAVQTLQINFMSTHVDKYPMLVRTPSFIKPIAQMESELNGQTCRYIPKVGILNNAACKQAVKDGNILALVTSRQGLDTSHVGFAIWKKDGLHLFHASSLQKKVVEDKSLLRNYMMKQKSQLGVRVVKVK